MSRLSVIVGALALIGADAAATRDRAMCEREQKRTVDGVRLTTQNCPVYVPKRLGYVPVVKFGNRSHEVGKLLKGGSVNWFVCQMHGASQRVTEGRYFNTWWALTLSDDGHRGWVNEVYFKGGRNDERDGGLRACQRADIRWGQSGRPDRAGR